MTSLEEQRTRMLDEHLVRRGIRDQRVIEAMAAIPRECFVPEAFTDEAYADRALPLGGGQTISQPFIVGLIAQSLRLGPHETVLEVGSGSGYMAAVLAKLANWVVGIEMVPELARDARQRLEQLGIDHVEIHIGDGSLGWPEEAPYDAIVVSAAAPEVPPALLAQLADDGRLVMPIGEADAIQKLVLLRRQQREWVESVLCACKFVPLVTPH